MHNIVISGSNSFIGKHLIAKLSGNKKFKLIKMNRSFGDIKYANTWKKLPKANILIHLAAKTFVPDSWKNPKEFFDTNIIGTIMALEYCRLNKTKFIFLSSYLYGNAKYFPTDEKSKLEIKNPYSFTKKTAEDICKFYSKKYKLKVVILRPSNAYGPGQKLFFLIPDIIKKLKKKNF
jgi:nucleoside-diphosphate-sugar epimerase